MSVTESTDTGIVLEIPQVFNHYELIQTIGTGANSVVIKVQHKATNEFFAAKVVSRKSILETGQFPYFEREVRVLQRITHPNIVKVNDVVYLDELIIVVMDYCENGDLLTFMREQTQLTLPICRQLFYQLAQAVGAIHKRQIAHRDIKPENIFLDSNYVLKLGDFGLSQEIKNNRLLSTLCGTLYYAAPEVIKGEMYDGQKADIWSLGILLFVMNVGSLPWQSIKSAGITEEIIRGHIYIPDNVTPEVKDIIQKCTILDPQGRPSIMDLLKMPWIEEEKQSFERRFNIKSIEMDEVDKSLKVSKTFIKTSVRSMKFNPGRKKGTADA